MKCIKLTGKLLTASLHSIQRVSDSEAYDAVKAGDAVYINKKAWKRQVAESATA